ncbi:TAXI family TRAP transporter solute-binding subunit [Nocardiopsis lambiniae]|uniref:TAXI family TRAP transporter solute-binding subunit n=1 Tax=Nocardiopsis lambiniae TaxID=3075539 RepID=A0ABU2M4I2_9ACTN|nr:TAXI family TRAP transporter solute-binding subunit [Nocardiopsis sp. DSM 44743]MDT0326916.1 TAXI family TRAP transporter solute-binding subunit [Nocardiopsis sp. DSM 44743]
MRSEGPNRRTVLRGAVGALVASGMSGCGFGAEAAPAELIVATGPPGAVYREIGTEIATLLDARLPDTSVRTVETRASHDNLRLLARGTADLGLSSLDSVLAGEITDASPLRAIGRLYDSFVHLVVLDGSGIRRAADLAGRRVSVGAVNSGTEFTALQIIAETGVEPELVRLDQAASAEALWNREIEAMFSLTGLPTPAIADLAERHGVRLIDLSGIAVTMVDAHPEAYFPATIPATTYRGIPACPTMSVPNLLLCPSSLPDDLAHTITDTVYTGAARIARTRPEAAQINVRTGISTGVVPLHPGAEQWYRENKPA